MLSLKLVAYDQGTMYIPLSPDALDSLDIVVKMDEQLNTAGTIVQGHYRVHSEGESEEEGIVRRKEVFDKLRALGFQIQARGAMFDPTDETLGNLLSCALEGVVKSINKKIELKVAFNFYNSLIYDSELPFPASFDPSSPYSRVAVENAIAYSIVVLHGKTSLSIDGKIRAMECVRKNLFY